MNTQRVLTIHNNKLCWLEKVGDTYQRSEPIETITSEILREHNFNLTESCRMLVDAERKSADYWTNLWREEAEARKYAPGWYYGGIAFLALITIYVAIWALVR